MLLGLTQKELAARADVRLKLVNSFEGQQRAIPDDDIDVIQDYLENAGILFLFNRDIPIGVRLADQEPYRWPEEKQPMRALHFKMARAWLRWTHETLAEMADISPSTVRDFEKHRRNPHKQSLTKAEIAFKVRGIRFLYNRDRQAIGIEVVNGLAVAA